MPKPWERQVSDAGHDEPDKAYAAFCLYRDAGPDQRSLELVTAAIRERQAQKFSDSDKAGEKAGRKPKRVSTQVEEWSAEWNWVLRARAWDDECDRRRRAAQLEEIEKMAKRQAQQAEAGAAVLMQPITALLLRLQMEPTLMAEIPVKDLVKLSIVSARALGRVQQAERVARGNPEALQEKSDKLANIDLKDAQFAWVQGTCVCGHAHSNHDQMYEADQKLVPCTVDGCGCRKYKDAEDVV